MASSISTGAANPSFNAMKKIVDVVGESLTEYKISSVPEGIDALDKVAWGVVDGGSGKQFIGAFANTEVVLLFAIVHKCSESIPAEA